MIYFENLIIPCEILIFIVFLTLILYTYLHVITVLNLAELFSSFLYNFIFLATLQLGQMVRTYQTVRKRRGNLPGQMFVDEAGVSVYELSVLCIVIVE